VRYCDFGEGLLMEFGELIYSSAADCFKLRKEFEEVHAVKGWTAINGFQRVGKGEKTNDSCGRFRNMYLGCSRVDLHNKITLDGVNYAGKVEMIPLRFSCHRPSCPECYESWCLRQAKSATLRIEEMGRRLGSVVGVAEHIICSPSQKDWGLPYEVLCRKAQNALEARGIIGSCAIFHAERKNKIGHRYWSPHFHCVGFLSEGYHHCRACLSGGLKPDVEMCSACGGFEDVTRSLYLVDGFIVKVLGKRKSVESTIRYELTHASYKVDSKRFHILRWWGVVSYKKMKYKVVLPKAVCPICGSELQLHAYLGNRSICTDRSSSDYKSKLLLDSEEDGRNVWLPFRNRSGSSAYLK
jgi:hypothetical protein